MRFINQRTISKEIEFKGIALHSGSVVKVTMFPAESNERIVFRRSDLENKEIKSSATRVTDTTMCTCLREGEVKISTIEHLMAALSLLGIDNIVIELNNEEVPIMDGSSLPFIYLIREAGIKELSKPKKFIKVKKQVEIKKDGKIAYFLPNEDFILDYEIDFDHPIISSSNQKEIVNFNKDDIITSISRARTFGFIKDIEFLLQNNLAKGGSTNNAVILDETRVLNEDGLRYKDEFVKHKILDAIGDLYVSGMQIQGYFHAYKAGHEINNLLIRELLSCEENYSIEEIQLPTEIEASESKLSFLPIFAK